MTSFSEAFGLVLVEAENYGLPLVAFSSAQGANEIIQNNINGFLIENREKSKMAEALIKLIENKELRQEMGCKGKEMSKLYCRENVSKKWTDFINSI